MDQYCSYDKSNLNALCKLTDDFYLDTDKQLGAGACGVVFKGYSVKRNRNIAIKTVANQSGYEREVETLEALSSLIHDNIMGFYGHLKKPDTIYLFMEYCPNGCLSDAIKKGITQLEALKLFRQLVEGMCYMNAKGKMHRDLKPDNILMGVQNDIKISDFGLARESSSSDIFVTGQLGTAFYAGPEVFLNDFTEAYSEKCDVWGAGMILYEMLMGKSMFYGIQTLQGLRKEWGSYEKGEKWIKYPPELHPNWEYFTNLMMTFDPKKRPTFHVVLQKLKSVDEQMRKEIANKILIVPSMKIGRLETFLQFEMSKYQVLITVCECFTAKKMRMRNEMKYSLMLFCLALYLTHMNQLIRGLKYKRMRRSQEDQEELIDQYDPEFDIVLDKYRCLIENKFNLFFNQLQKVIILKIINDYDIRPDSKAILADIGIVPVAKYIRESGLDIEDIYLTGLKDLVDRSQKYIVPPFDQYTDEELQIYRIVLIGSKLNEVFPPQKNSEAKLVGNLIAPSFKMSRVQLLSAIQTLRQL